MREIFLERRRWLDLSGNSRTACLPDPISIPHLGQMNPCSVSTYEVLWAIYALASSKTGMVMMQWKEISLKLPSAPQASYKSMIGSRRAGLTRNTTCAKPISHIDALRTERSYTVSQLKHTRQQEAFDAITSSWLQSLWFLWQPSRH